MGELVAHKGGPRGRKAYGKKCEVKAREDDGKYRPSDGELLELLAGKGHLHGKIHLWRCHYGICDLYNACGTDKHMNAYFEGTVVRPCP